MKYVVVAPAIPNVRWDHWYWGTNGWGSLQHAKIYDLVAARATAAVKTYTFVWTHDYAYFVESHCQKLAGNKF
jgi:hypothetical protein